MGFITDDHQDSRRVPVLEDLPDPAGKAVMVRATFDLPLVADPAQPLPMHRAQGLAATLEWLHTRGARITVCGTTGAPDAPGEAHQLEQARQAVSSISAPNLVESAEFSSSPEEPDAVGRLVESHDLFVNDTLQDSFLPLPSLILPPRRLPSAVGRTLQQDLEILDGFLVDPARPAVVVLGGERSLDRLRGLEGLVLRADTVLLGGALALPMLQALGRQSAAGQTEAFLWGCRKILGLSRRVNHPITLPVDLVWRRSDGSVEVTPSDLRGGDEVVDIGPKTRVRFAQVVAQAGCTLWAGALGVVEDPRFAEGTQALAASLPDKPSVVFGGDALVAALRAANLLPASAAMLSATDAAVELLKDGDLAVLAALRQH